MKFLENHPHLYTCSVCGLGVKVIPQGEGNEPLYEYDKNCSHRNVTINANRKVILRGKGKLNSIEEASYKIRVSLSQLLSWITKRSF